MPAVFVTASGTDIGKTFVAEAMLREWRAQGHQVAALKPVISGFDPAQAAETDTGRLLAAAGADITDDSVALVSPWRYAAPLSPDMAAAREGRTVPFDDVVAYCLAAIHEAHETGMYLLIEGIGGVMVPLDETRTVADLIGELGIPAIVVGGSYLGSLSHTLTACEALQARRVPIDTIVISETPDSEVPLVETRDTVARFVGKIPVEAVAYQRPV
jgi:dethiobiotin synthetase